MPYDDSSRPPQLCDPSCQERCPAAVPVEKHPRRGWKVPGEQKARDAAAAPHIERSAAHFTEGFDEGCGRLLVGFEWPRPQKAEGPGFRQGRSKVLHRIVAT